MDFWVVSEFDFGWVVVVFALFVMGAVSIFVPIISSFLLAIIPVIEIIGIIAAIVYVIASVVKYLASFENSLKGYFAAIIQSMNCFLGICRMLACLVLFLSFFSNLCFNLNSGLNLFERFVTVFSLVDIVIVVAFIAVSYFIDYIAFMFCASGEVQVSIESIVVWLLIVLINAFISYWFIKIANHIWLNYEDGLNVAFAKFPSVLKFVSSRW